jgi:hypothetical protein
MSTYAFLNLTCDLHVTPCNTSRQHCHTAMKLLNILVPNFESNTDIAENLDLFCALVCVPFYISSSNHSDLKLSCSQVPMMLVVITQADSKSQSRNGSTTVTIWENASLPTGRTNVALAMTLLAALFAQSIMIGIIQSELRTRVSHSI